MRLLSIVCLAVTMGGCRKVLRSDSSGVTGDRRSSARAPGPVGVSGVVVDREFRDQTYPLVIPVPGEWSALPGTESSELRATLTHLPTGTRIEIRVLPSSASVLPPREDCVWSFSDEAHYRSVPVGDRTRVATCTPHDPLGARVLASVLEIDGEQVLIEAAVPPASLVEGKRAVDALVVDVRWEGL